jgi:hypothetical protein
MTHRSNRRPALLGPVLPLEDRIVPFTTSYALSNNTLIPFDPVNPAVITSPITIAGLNAGDTLVGIDYRPQNGFLYGLGFNAGAGTVQLYAISPRGAFAEPIGTTGTFVNAGGTAVPITGTKFGFDFSPLTDRIRVVNDAGQNFRIDPNSGAFVDGDLGGAANSVTGLNMDGAINGPVTGVDGAAYTNNAPNATVTTLYTLSGTSHALYVQNPSISGTQSNTLPITLGGAALNFTGSNGFDIPEGVNVTTSGAPATGQAFAALTVGGTTGLYRIELSTGVATLVGSIAAGTSPVQGMAIAANAGSLAAVGLSGSNLVRFNTATPGTGTTVGVTGLVAGETLVGIDWRPQTGQLYGLGVNATANTGTLYRIDPQTGAAVIVGTASQVAYVDGGGAAVDLPAPATAGYGLNFDPVADQVRFTTITGLNARINPTTGAPIDGDLGGAAGSVTGVNPDGAINQFVTGVDGIAYTNSSGQSLGGGSTTLYTISSQSHALYIQTPPNSGTQTTLILVTLNGTVLNFTTAIGFDIPAEVRVGSSNAPATGKALALLTVGGATHLYSIDLTTGDAADLGAAAAALTGATGLALGDGQFAVPTLNSNLMVSGLSNGQAAMFTPNASGQYSTTPTATFSPFAGFSGNLRAAVGDVNGDGKADTILVTGPGTPIRFAVISGVDNTTVLIPPTAPFAGSEDFTGGGFVAAADLTGDGRAEMVFCPDQGGGPRVTIFSLDVGGLTLRTNFFGINDPSFRGGARPALGDVNGDGTPDLAVAAGFLGGPRIAIFNGATLFTTQAKLLNDFFAFPGTDATTLRNGAFVALGDVNGDGFADAIFGGGPGGAPRVFILSGKLLATATVADAYASPVANFFVAGNSSDRGGVRVAAKNADGDTKADVAIGSGEGSPAKVRVYLGKNFTSIAEPTTFQDITVFGGGVLSSGVFVG